MASSERSFDPNFPILNSIVCAALGSGALTIVFTTPQIINLSQTSKLPLPTENIHIFQKHGMQIFKRAIATQTVNKVIHFGGVRLLKQSFDLLPGGGLGQYNLNVAYGLISVPVQAWAYNSLNADVFQYFGQSKPTEGSFSTQAKEFFMKKIRPGFGWTFLRDSNSVGGGLILGPIITAKYISSNSNGNPSRLERLFGGFIAGCICGFGTQMFHNAALTAGRAAELGENIGNMEAMRRLWNQIGVKAIYQGYPYRVAVIAGMSALLNVCEPFK